MIINKLNLTNFRSYKKESINLSKKINVFTGDNGAGKTNILEAIYTLAVARSYKAKDEDMINRGSDFFKISANIENKQKEDNLVLVGSKQGKKVFQNDVEIKKLSDFVGLVNVVLFSPEDLLLLKNGPQERRKLIDLSLLQISKKYVENSAAFKKQLKLRNDYLKYLEPKLENKEVIEDEMLNVLTNNFIECNRRIFEARKAFIERLEKETKETYKMISGTNDEIRFEYLINFNNSLDFYKEKYKTDILYGATQNGCHRDDMKFYRNNIDLETEASQGELRMLSLSIKLALSKIINNLKTESPIVLLDDVLSELDSFHQNKLLFCLDRNMQIIITTTDINKLDAISLKEAKLFKVKDKRVTELENIGIKGRK